MTCNHCQVEFKPKHRVCASRIPKFCSRKCFYSSFTSVNNPNWAGNKVKYRGIHNWIVRLLGKPSTCRECGKVGYGHHMHWANISGNYLREVDDWVRMCAKCHKNYDVSKKICQQ